jgi:hypothetical protein
MQKTLSLTSGLAVLMLSNIAFAQSSYHKGELLARALEQGAVVFTGTVIGVRAVNPPAGADAARTPAERTIDLNSLDWLLAPASTQRVAQLTVRAFDPPVRSKTLEGPWAAWQGIDTKPGTKLLLVRTPGATPPGGDSEQPWLVASQPNEIAEIAGLVRTFTSIENDFSQTTVLAANIRQPNDGLVAGFGITYLADCGARKDLAQTASLLASFAGSEGATEAGWRASLSWLTSTWYRLPEASRTQAGEAIITAAASSKAVLSRIAFSSLLDLYSAQPGIFTAVVPAAVRTSLRENYRSLQTSGAIPQRNAGFEKALGLEGR